MNSLIENVKNNNVFLGGTCNGSHWRDAMEDCLYHEGVTFFNPVVDDWNDEAYARELLERETCDFCLYTITPKMTGVYSIAEVVDDSNKRPEKTVLVVLYDDEGNLFSKDQVKSLKAVEKLVSENGGMVFDSLFNAAKWMGIVLRQEGKI